jgi:hypothetical protein
MGNGYFMEQSKLQKRGLERGQIKMSCFNHRFGEGDELWIDNFKLKNVENHKYVI